jgi:hypothetical protein
MDTTAVLVDMFSLIRQTPGLSSSKTASFTVPTGNAAYTLSVNTMTTGVNFLGLTKIQTLLVNHELSWKTATAPAAGSIV